MTPELADIPRALTGLAEWGACVVYVLVLPQRLRRLAVAAVLAAGLVVLVGVQLVAGALPLALWIPGMLLAAAAMYALVLASARVSPVAAGYLTARAFVLAELVASIAWQIARFYAPQDDLLRSVLVLAVGVPALALSWIAERRHMGPDDAPEVGTGDLISALAIAAVTFTVSNLSFVSASTPFSGRIGPEVFYIRTLVDLCGYIALYVQHQVRRELHARRDTEAMERLLTGQRQQYELTRRAIDDVNRKHHDMRHHLEAIRAAGDPLARARMLDELEGSLDRYDEQTRTGNRVLDAVLTAKRVYADEREVQVSYVADGRLLEFVRALDITSIAGNALDNAIEAAGRVDPVERRSVRFAVFAQDGFVVLRVENTFDGVVHRRDGRLITRKRTAGHGYGLRSIEVAAEAYEATVSAVAADDWFTLTVLFPRSGA